MRGAPSDVPDGNMQSCVKKHKAALLDMLDGNISAYPLPLATYGTAFQKNVWHAICQVGYGHTASYQQLAKQLGTKASRAVGMACGANPVPITISCHRILRSNGELGGFAFGLPLKKALLAHEQALSNAALAA